MRLSTAIVQVQDLLIHSVFAQRHADSEALRTVLRALNQRTRLLEQIGNLTSDVPQIQAILAGAKEMAEDDEVLPDEEVEAFNSAV